jgi:hypothetical protein
MSFAAMTHLAEGLRFNALLTLKILSPLIYLVGTRIPTVSMIDWKFILHLKTLIRNKASRCRRLKQSVLKFKQLKIQSYLRKISNRRKL